MKIELQYLKLKTYFEKETPKVIIHEYDDAVQSYTWKRISELQERRIVRMQFEKTLF
jgi:hypothetical protein